jgi:hypothetical protein
MRREPTFVFAWLVPITRLSVQTVMHTRICRLPAEANHYKSSESTSKCGKSAPQDIGARRVAFPVAKRGCGRGARADYAALDSQLRSSRRSHSSS